MAALVLTDAKTIIGVGWTGTGPGSGSPTVSGTVTTDLALNDHIRAVNLSFSAAVVDFTTFADGAYMVEKPGLKSGQLSIEFNNDHAAANVDATFGAAILAGTHYYIDIKPTSSARGSTNPSYVVYAWVEEYAPFGQSVGDAATATVTFHVVGTPARLTS